jgi:solute carrier family 35 protein E1
MNLEPPLCTLRPRHEADGVTAFLTLQTKYDANQQARKHLLPVTTGDLSSKEHHRSPLEKPHNGTLFPPHSDYQYGRNNILTDHFQYGRPSYPNSYTLNRYDV